VPAPPAPPANPVYAPDVGDDGAAAPLGARRVAWRPPDEPPVEQWRREGLVDGVSADPVETDPFAVPPVDPAATVVPPPAPPAPPASTVPPAPPVGDPAPAAFATPFPEPEPTIPPPVERPFTPTGAPGPADASAPGGADDYLDHGPLPTRIPGQHLSHHPAGGGAPTDADADPMRPYRVHELLTRHAQGKRRGRAEQDGTTTDAGVPAGPGSGDAGPEMTVPDAFGHVQEDGR
jgi:hypothetical protein